MLSMSQCYILSYEKKTDNRSAIKYAVLVVILYFEMRVIARLGEKKWALGTEPNYTLNE